MLNTSAIDTPIVLACGAVDVEVQPGRVGAEAGEQALQAGRRRCPSSTIVVGHVLQRVEPGVAAVLDDDLEAAGRAQARRPAARRRR